MTDEFERDLRAAALALVEDAPPPPEFPALRTRPRTHRRRVGPWLLAAAAATAAVVALALDGGGPERADTVVVAEPGPSTTAVSAPAFTCGSQLPGEPWVPAGYAGPDPGPAAEADEPPSPGQLVLRWPGATGSIELRWPPDPAVRHPFLDAPADTSGPPRLGSGAALQPRLTARGLTVRYELLGLKGSLPDAACRVIQVGVFDADPARAQATVEWLQRSPFVPTAPLLASREVADAPPAIGLCRGSSPNRQGGGEGSSFPTPDAALQHFVESNRGFLLRGYVEFRLPDGTYAYAARVQDQWVTVVHVDRTEVGTWTVTRFEATGC